MDAPAVTVTVESAKSGRSRCGACKEGIARGEMRVGSRRRCVARAYWCTTWHHVACAQEIGLLQSEPAARPSTPLPAPIQGDDPWCVATPAERAKFSAAARLAVAPRIAAFRADATQDRCPITGESIMEPAVAHVHHFGPNDFAAIVRAFLLQYDVRLARVSYTAGGFSSPSLEGTFVAFHDERARLLLVHPTANMSLLKRTPNLGPCDGCGLVAPLTWAFLDGFCSRCAKGSPGLWRRYASYTYALRTYGLEDGDLADLVEAPFPNPKNHGFAPMRLFKRADVEARAAGKYGSVDAAVAHVAHRRRCRDRKRRAQYALAAQFHLTLRSGKRHRLNPVDDTAAAPLASRAQLRYLRILGGEPALGISRDQAAELIVALQRQPSP